MATAARPEFETAYKVAATLGDEEQLPGYSADPSSKGGLWLWAALAMVVGGTLLWVVAKRRPKKQG